MLAKTIKKKALSQSLLLQLQSVLTGLNEKNTKRINREIASHSEKVAKKYVALLKKEAALNEKIAAKAEATQKKAARKEAVQNEKLTAKAKAAQKKTAQKKSQTEVPTRNPG